MKTCSDCGYRSDKESEFAEIQEEGGSYWLCNPCLEGIEDIIDSIAVVQQQYSTYVVKPSGKKYTFSKS